VIDETAGRGDDDVDAASQRLDLRAHRHSPEDSGNAETGRRSVRYKRAMYLDGQFPGGNEDERAWRRRDPTRDQTSIEAPQASRGFVSEPRGT
jgi:hypothetical protein